MGIFEYECPAGHVSDHFVSLLERPDMIPCKADGCSNTAHFIISPARTTFHANDRRAIKGQTVNRGGTRS